MLGDAKAIPAIPVTDFDRASKFYGDILGLTTLMENAERGVAFYKVADGYLQIYQRETATSGEHTTAAFSVSGDFDAVVDHLIKNGVTFDTFPFPDTEAQWDERGILSAPEMGQGGWFKDPDGNVLQILQSPIFG